MNSLKKFFIATTIAALAATGAWGADVYLVAAPLNLPIQVNDGGTLVNVPMWGFGIEPDGDFTTIEAVASVPGPKITLGATDTTLTVHLYNNLLTETVNAENVNVSLMIPGLPKTPVPATVVDGQARTRAVSFDAEVAPGASGTFTWNNVRPGTFIYQSASHPAVQV
jgi:hypothetical protein